MKTEKSEIKSNRFAFVTGLLLIIFHTAVAQTARPVPAPYSQSAKINYIRTWDALVPETNSNNITASTASTNFRMATQYITNMENREEAKKASTFASYKSNPN